VGEEPFVIAVGEGPDGRTDLFAAPAGGGVFTRLTFTRPEERFPHISPGGTAVAYLRSGEGTGSARWSLVIQNLLTNAEAIVPLPAAAGDPQRLGWDRGGKRVVLRAQGFFVTGAPPERAELVPFPRDSLALADSLTTEQLGDPPQAMVEQCADGRECIRARSGEVSELDLNATGAVRWGGDSVGYFLPEGFEVRPLRGGHPRRPVWTGTPERLRQLSYHAGPQVTTSRGVSGIR
jgi:hypothetical protein